jgi:hypothetical protein
MALRVVGAFLVCLCIAGFGLFFGLRSIQIVDRVNAKLPKAERFAPIGFKSFSERSRLYAEYDRLYPDNHWRRDFVFFCAVIIIGGLALYFLGFIRF